MGQRDREGRAPGASEQGVGTAAGERFRRGRQRLNGALASIADMKDQIKTTATPPTSAWTGWRASTSEGGGVTAHRSATWRQCPAEEEHAGPHGSPLPGDGEGTGRGRGRRMGTGGWGKEAQPCPAAGTEETAGRQLEKRTRRLHQLGGGGVEERGGETAPTEGRRLPRAGRDLADRHQVGRVLVVTHGCMRRVCVVNGKKDRVAGSPRFS